MTMSENGQFCGPPEPSVMMMRTDVVVSVSGCDGRQCTTPETCAPVLGWSAVQLMAGLSVKPGLNVMS